MADDFQREYLVQLPLPLAQLYSRAYNAKDARGRHDNAFYLVEALTKLAAAPLVEAYLREVDQGAGRVAAIDRILAALALPSLGQWVGIFRELARYFGQRPDAPSHPLGHLWKQVDTRRRDLPAIVALFQRIKNGPDGQPAGDQSCSLLDLFDALVQYRNGVFGHGAGRFDSFYEQEMGPLLFPALNELLRNDVLRLLGPEGTRLVYLTELRTLDENRRELSVRELVGLHAERMDPIELTTEQAEQVLPNRVAVLWPGRKTPLMLEPLLAYRENEQGEEVLFLNRDRNGRQVELLSYTTGRTERDKSLAPAMARLLGRIAGRVVTEEEMVRLGEQTAAETPSIESLVPTSHPQGQIVGEFEILVEIGRGGMGVVYLARQLSLGRLVALKMLPADLTGNELALARFRREMRALGSCEHPNIVKVLSSGALPDGQLYYAMEYVPGTDLEQVWRELSGSDRADDISDMSGSVWARAVILASRKQRESTARKAAGDPTSAGRGDSTAFGRDRTKPITASAVFQELGLPLPPLPELPPADTDPGGYSRHVVKLIGDVASAVQTVHDQHIVHRDIKPSNLMLTADGSRVVLMDFGLAKGQSLSLTTASSGFLGTLRYGAPELLASARVQVDHRADVYALGVTLWELLARRRLFNDAEDEKQLTSWVLTKDRPLLRTIDPSLDPDLEAVVARAMERDPALRYQRAAELADDLKRWEDGEPVKARRYTLAHRIQRRMRRHRRVLAAAALAVAAVLMAGLWYWDGYVRLHEEYYARAVSRWAAPHGIHRLTLDEVRHREASLKMYRQGRYGEVVRMKEINGSGQPASAGLWSPILESTDSTTGSRDDVLFEFERDANGNVVRETAYDVAGRLVFAFVHNKSFTGGHYVTGEGEYVQPRSGSGAAYLEYERSPEGFYTEIRFRDETGQPQPDKDGDYGMRYTREPGDERGLPVMATNLDREGKIKRHKVGFASIRYVYDEDGNSLEYHMLDENGQPTLHKYGYAISRGRYDEYGNQVEWVYLGLDGDLTLCQLGYARATHSYDEFGNDKEAAFWGLNGEPVPQQDGYARRTATYDERGNQLETARFGVEGEPTLAKYGYWKVRKVYDDQNNVLEESYWGLHDEPVLHANGYALARMKYDDQGNMIEQSYFDTHGNPTPHTDGNARWTARYDDAGKQIERSYYGTDGELTPYKDGYARFTWQRDRRENIVEVTYWGVDGELALHKDGYARETRGYDDRGYQVTSEHWGIDGRPASPKNDHFSKLRVEYDRRGNVVKVAYFDGNWQSVVSLYGAAYHTYRYDDRGNKLEVAYYDGNDRYVANTDYFAIVRRQFDSRGNEIETAYFDAQEKPVEMKDGYHKAITRFDERGNVVEKSYFSAEDEPIAHRQENARWTARYDQRGNCIEVVHFGPDRMPGRHSDGYMRWTADYDTRGNVIKKTYSGYDGTRGFQQRADTYDDRGNNLEAAFLEADGQPATHRDGYSKWVSEYDDRKNEVTRTHYDATGNVVKASFGYAKWKTRYNDQNKRTELAYFDPDDRPAAHTDGNAKRTAQFDERGNEVEVAYYDVDNNLVNLKDGYAKVKRKYDERGNIIELTYFGSDDKPIATPLNFTGWTAEHDQRGNTISVAYFGVDGQPARHKNGYTKVLSQYDDHDRHTVRSFFGYDDDTGFYQKTQKFDEQGKVVETEYFDRQGNPTKLADGYAGWNAKYDARGNQIELAYFGVDGAPAPYKNGYSSWKAQYDDRDRLREKSYYSDDESAGQYRKTIVYDESGNAVTTAAFDREGRPATLMEEYARETAVYDDRGNRIETAFFGPDGAPARNEDGYRKRTSRYDEENRLITTTYVGYSDDKGYDQKTLTYNERGKLIETAFFDRDGQAAEDEDGHARWTRGYDEAGNEIENAFFDAAGNPARYGDGYVGWTAKYDDQGRRIERAYHGYDGGQGYAQKLLKYDDRGYNVEVVYLDREGKPVMYSGGYASAAATYDDRGNQIEMAFFDVQGAPVRIEGGYTRWTESFDEQNRRRQRAEFGLAVEELGYSQARISYDEQGRIIELAVFDAEGNPATATNGAYRLTATFDESGNQIGFASYGWQGEPVRLADGFASWTASYDANGNMRERTYTGYDGSQGFVAKTLKYDERGNIIEDLRLDDDGQPANDSDGRARTLAQYDGRNNVTSLSFFAADGKPVLNSQGYAKSVATYDEDGNESGRQYFGLSGEPLVVDVVVEEVVAGGQGAEMGFQVGDVLTRYDGDDVTGVSQFIYRRAQEAEADPARVLVVTRGSETVELEVKPGLLGLRLGDRILPPQPSP